MESQRVATVNTRADFEYNWSTIFIREVGQRLHEHLRASWATQGPKNIPITRFSKFILT